MPNILNHIFQNVDIRLDNSENYDFCLSNDATDFSPTDNTISFFDFNDPNIYISGNYNVETIFSSVIWEEAINDGLILNNIGYTGLDNGLIFYEKDPADIANEELLEALTGTVLEIVADEKSLILHPVSGYTGNITYPMTINNSPTVGNYAHLCGGFFQGFYGVDEQPYQVLPNRYAKGWTVDFWVNRNGEVACNNPNPTLNDVYPDNEGFLFYLGTRAENKFWTVFEGLNLDGFASCPIGCTEWCTVLKETDIITTDGYPLSPPPLIIREITNKFLIYSRANGVNRCSPGNAVRGETVCSFTGDSITTTATTMLQTDFRNPFQIYSRANGVNRCAPGRGVRGETVCSYSGDSIPLLELDYKRDLINNAFGIRLRNDGSIGYRVLRHTCISGDTGITSGITVEEQYSHSGLVDENQWSYITVKYVADTRYDRCKLQEREARNGKLYFYINARLKLVVNNVEEIIPKRLKEHHQKQEGVPYNISLGGGTQGLLESMTFDGQDPDDLGLLLEKYFAGTFIGGVSRFRIYQEPLNWCEIKGIFETEATEFGLSIIPDFEP